MSGGQRAPSVVAFLAVGTRGDVQPLAILASNLAKRGRGDVNVHFITHCNFKSLVEAPLTSAGVCSVEYLSLPPATPATAATSRAEVYDDHRERQQRYIGDEQHREECIRALESAFACSATGHDRGSSQRGDKLNALVVINLFALEGWHIAEAMGIPCAVVSPTVVPYTPPSSFARRFERAYPGLYQRLLDQADGAPASWREVEHWLWPVFTERWGQWRSQRLCLSEVPLLTNNGVAAKRPTKVIYGCSPSIIQVPGYWPDTVQVCGFWFPPDDWEANVLVPQRLMREFFVDSGGGVVAITLSTIFDMGLIRAEDKGNQREGGRKGGEQNSRDEIAKHVITVLKRALKTSGLKGIFVISNDSCLASAWKSLYPRRAGMSDNKRKLGDDVGDVGAHADESWVGGDETVQGYVGSIPFQQLFPMCLGVLHHGGSGTTAAALRAGVPQIMCPCIFDQFSWAERLSWLGVSSTPLKSSDFFGSAETIEKKLSAAFGFLSRSDARNCAKILQQSVVSEHQGAVDTAVDALESAVGKRILRPEYSWSDVKMLELPNGWHVACTAKAEALFLFNEMDAYFRHVSPIPDGVIIDVGANIGMFLLATNAWLRRNGNAAGLPPRARHYLAIEPLHSNAACFEQNIMIHEASSGVELHRCGLTDEVHARKGSLNFTHYPNMPGNSTARPDEKVALQKNNMKPDFFAGAQVVLCPVSTLTALLDEFHPDIKKIDLVKVDVEGAELEVLQGISDKWWQVICQVVIEVHDVDDRVKAVEALLHRKNLKTKAEPQEFGSNAWLVWGFRWR